MRPWWKHLNEPQLFLRTPDSYFYESPRFVTHIDDPAIAALTKFYSEVFPPSNTPGVSMLDMCSSWVSPFLDLNVLQFSFLVFMNYVKKVCGKEHLIWFFESRFSNPVISGENIQNLSFLSLLCRSVIFQQDTSKKEWLGWEWMKKSSNETRFFDLFLRSSFW